MAEADVRWLQRLDNYGRALATLQRAIATARSRALSELEEQGLIQAFEFTHELSWHHQLQLHNRFKEDRFGFAKAIFYRY